MIVNKLSVFNFTRFYPTCHIVEIKRIKSRALSYNNNVTWFTTFLLSYCLFKSNLKSLLRKSWELFILIYNSLYVAMTKTVRIYAAGMLNDLYLHWLKYIHKLSPSITFSFIIIQTNVYVNLHYRNVV